MDSTQRTGMIVSGCAHAFLILWLIVGGVFFSHDLPPPVATAEVALMSSADFAALQAAAPTAEIETPPEPSAPAPPAAEDVPETPAAVAAPEPALPVEPEDQAPPDPAPDVTALTPPETEVTDTPPTPVETPNESAEPVIQPSAEPKPADIVAPDPTPEPEPETDVAPEAVAETAPEPSPEAPVIEPEEAAAPRETGEILRTEENERQTELASAAPTASPRPKARPERPEPVAEPEPARAEPEPEPEPAAEPEAPAEDAVAQALAEALSGAASDDPAPGTGTAPSGPPMTDGEKDALVIAVKQCWNVGALSTDALRTVVTVGLSMDPSGVPIGNSIRMIGYEGGDESAARQAYEAGRRAILRCARNGYPLPPDKYDQWREVEIVFNPEKMRMK